MEKEAEDEEVRDWQREQVDENEYGTVQCEGT